MANSDFTSLRLFESCSRFRGLSLQIKYASLAVRIESSEEWNYSGTPVTRTSPSNSDNPNSPLTPLTKDNFSWI